MGTTPRTPRLCSEIQLFDLCDLETCCQKNGRYCTNQEVLDRFEAIKEEDERSPEQYIAEDFEEDEDEASEDLNYEEADDDDEFDGEDR
jgi:hypothetical protein